MGNADRRSSASASRLMGIDQVCSVGVDEDEMEGRNASSSWMLSLLEGDDLDLLERLMSDEMQAL